MQSFRVEYVSVSGLRVDGRRAAEVRKLRCRFGLFQQVDGSAYFEQGNTKCVAVVFGPQEMAFKSKALHDRAVINCEFRQYELFPTEGS